MVNTKRMTEKELDRMAQNIIKLVRNGADPRLANMLIAATVGITARSMGHELAAQWISDRVNECLTWHKEFFVK